MKMSPFFLIVVPVLALFLTSGIFINTQLDAQMRGLLQAELMRNARMVQGFLESTSHEASITSLNPLIHRLRPGDDEMRITLIDGNGVVLADSARNDAEVMALDNYGARPEVLAATDNAPGVADRYSSTLQANSMYVALPHRSSSFNDTIRVAMPLTAIENFGHNLRLMLNGLGLAGLVTLVAIIWVATSRMKRVNAAHSAKLEARVVERTQDIERIQKFGQVLAACETINELTAVVSTSLPKMFAGMSGAMSLFQPSMNRLDIVSSWGQKWTGAEIYAPNDCWAFRRGNTHISSTEEIGLRCKHIGAITHVMCTPLSAQGVPLGAFHLAMRDNKMSVDETRMARSLVENISLSLANINLRESLKNQAIRDPLTNLFNRRYLDESLKREVQRAGRHETSIGVIMLDVDHFKTFNDSFGHEAGDYVLQRVSSEIGSLIRGEDIACRFGGEEFTLIVTDASLDTTVKRAEKLLSRIREMSLVFRNKPLGQVTASIGIAVFPDHGDSPDALLAAADKALYAAKEGGRDRVSVFEGAAQEVQR